MDKSIIYFICLFFQFLIVASKKNEEPNHFFDDSNEICCQGEVFSDINTIPDPENRRCCSGKLFNALEFLCCNDSLHSRIADNSVWIECCNLTVYNIKTQVCCDGMILEKPTDSVEGEICCGKSIFDSSNHLCCAGIVVDKSGTASACCGSVAIDTSSQICCDDTILPKDEFTQCCGNEAYHFKEKVCCADKRLLPVPEGIANASCCGEVVFDTADGQHCCHDQVLSKEEGCCGGKSFDPSKHICCAPEPSNVNADIPPVLHLRDPKENMTCCGNQPSEPGIGCCEGIGFNEQLYTCCRGTLYVFDPNNPQKKACCFSDVDSISNSIES